MAFNLTAFIDLITKRMKNDRPLIRRTLSQERFEVLLKKQLKGTATFKELSELDEIANRDMIIKGGILEEMDEANHPPQDSGPQDIIRNTQPRQSKGLVEKVKEFFTRLFMIEIHQAVSTI